jgi:hypothetical protein
MRFSLDRFNCKVLFSNELFPCFKVKHIQIIYLQTYYIVLTLHCHVCKQLLYLDTFGVSTLMSMFSQYLLCFQCLFCFALHKTQGTRRIYTSSRRTNQRFMCTPLVLVWFIMFNANFNNISVW